jgi:hypothetical protein
MVDAITSTMMSKQAHSSETNRPFPKRFMGWPSQGLSARTASVRALAGCDNVEQVAAVGRSYFENFPNLREKSLARLPDLAGRSPKRRTVVDTALALGMDPEAARETATDVLTSHQKAGFVLTVSNRAGA